MRKASVVVAMVVALALLAYSQRSRYVPVDAGSKAPMFAEPGKVVLLNFWATWCVPCRKEMPALEHVAERYRMRGLEVIGVSADEKAADAREYADALGISFRIVHDATDSIQKAYQVGGLPTTYIIDKNGNIVSKTLGAKAWDDSAHAREFEKLLSQ